MPDDLGGVHEVRELEKNRGDRSGRGNAGFGGGFAARERLGGSHRDILCGWGRPFDPCDSALGVPCRRKWCRAAIPSLSAAFGVAVESAITMLVFFWWAAFVIGGVIGGLAGFGSWLVRPRRTALHA